MRLLRMKIENFLSIVKADIDFTKFKEGVFIISGPTGSGKSSVFDAIHFAFYGTPSNHNRNTVRKTLFSTYANSKSWLNVELTFNQSGKEYKILRSMNQAGNTGAKLWLPDGRILTKLKEIDDSITEIINLNGHQFDQMVMLEQNNFSKFLLADSGERGSLLRSVFDTEIFQFIQDYFKNKSSDIKKQIDDILTAERLILCGRTLEQMETDYTKSESEIGDLRRQKEELTHKLEEYQAQLPIRIEYESALAQYHLAVQELARLKNQEPEIMRLKALKELSGKLKSVGTLYMQYKGCEQSKASWEQAITQIKREIEALPTIDATSSVSVIKQYTNEKSSLIAAITNLKTLHAKEQELEDSQKKLIESRGLLPDLQHLKEVRDEKWTQLDCRLNYERAIKEYQVKQNQATEYRRYLETAKPQLQKVESELQNTAITFLVNHSEDVCPVCGKPYGDNHPKQTHQDGDADWGLYGRLQSGIEQARNIIAEFEQLPQVEECGISETSDMLSSELSIASSTYQDGIIQHEHYSTQITMLEQRIEALKADVDNLRKLCVQDSLETLQTKLSEIDLKIEDAHKKQEEADRIKAKYNELSGRLDIMNSKYNEISDMMNSLSALISWDLVPEYISHKDEIENWAANESVFLNQISQYDSQVYLYSSVTCPTTTIEKTGMELKLVIQGISSDLTVISGKVAGFEERQAQLQRAINQLKEYDKQRSKLRDSLKEYEYMAKQLSGDNASKVSLENFVLHRQLEWILQNSNKFLAQLSNNQYQLQLSWETLGRKQGGLDLSVLDTTNGTVRPTQTFSGGELFILSLSLSIGLMVSINAVFSTVSLEMLFIDEGFGTLDNVTLNRVLALIHSLQSVHSIGIISHVQDLIETIPQGLKVEKTLTGTRIKQF